MRKPRHCRNCGVVKESPPLPTVEHYRFSRYRDGRLKPPKGRFVNAMMCRACGKGVVWLYSESLPRLAKRKSPNEVNKVRIVAVQPQTWGQYPSSYYIRGKHELHQGHCAGFMEKLRRIKQIRESDLYVECPEVPK